MNRVYKKGFTIVELLVVIVVIGILAAITVVSYSGITNRANIASIQAELSGTSKQLAVYYTLNGFYPSALDPSTGCPTAPVVDTTNCVRFSTPTTYIYTYNNPNSFKLVATRGTNTYKISENSAPTVATITPITAIAAITGTAAVSEVITAGVLTPSDATATYQWQSSTSAGGTYINIPGATSSSYTLVPGDESKYLKVIATGSGDFSGVIASSNSTQIAASPWITIGTQTWARFNINIGTKIAGNTNQTSSVTTVEKYCYADNDANCTSYGALYQWDEAMQYSTTARSQGICPSGSHIPDDGEIQTLEVFLGMTPGSAGAGYADTTGFRGTDQGTKLKNGGSSGLNILLGGARYTDGSFNNTGPFTFFWSSSQSGGNAWARYLHASYATVYRDAYSKSFGFAVRCLKN